MYKLTSILLLIVLLTSCQSSSKKNLKVSDTVKSSGSKTAGVKQPTVPLKNYKINPGEELIYEDAGFATFSDSKRRGAGVISFSLDINDRLTIYNQDGSLFGQIVLNEDMTYYTLDMPRKTVARKIVPTFDFAAFNFDAEPVASNDDYLKIYANGELRKVNKAGVKYTFKSWDEYLKENADVSDD
jgi:hypothetical protein